MGHVHRDVCIESSKRMMGFIVPRYHRVYMRVICKELLRHIDEEMIELDDEPVDVIRRVRGLLQHMADKPEAQA